MAGCNEIQMSKWQCGINLAELQLALAFRLLRRVCRASPRQELADSRSDRVLKRSVLEHRVEVGRS